MAIYKNVAKGDVYYLKCTTPVKIHRSLRTKSLVEAKKNAKAMIEAEKAKKEPVKVTPSTIVESTGTGILLSEATKLTYDKRWKDLARKNDPLIKMGRIMELCGDVPIDTIGAAYINLLREKLFARDIKGTTVNRYMSDLRATLNWMQRSERLEKVPFFPMEDENERLRYFTRDEHDALTKKMAECHFKAGGRVGVRLTQFLIETGCRVSEALNCTWEKNIEVTSWEDENEPITIRLYKTKTKTPRSIPATKKLAQWLLFDWKGEERSGLLFPAPEKFHSSGGGKKGTRKKRETLTSDDYASAFSWCREKMNMSHDHEFLAHVLRHTCASRLVKQGVKLYDVMLWLGHTRYETVLRYSHFDDEQLLPAAAALNTAEGKAIQAHIDALKSGNKAVVPRL